MHPVLTFTVLLAALTTFTFDRDRVKYLERVRDNLPSITADEASTLCSVFKYDKDRLRALRLFKVTETHEYTEIEKVLRTFTFDSDRTEAAVFLGGGAPLPKGRVRTGKVSTASDYDKDAVIIINDTEYGVADFWPGEVIGIPEGTITCTESGCFVVRHGGRGVVVNTRGRVRELSVTP